MSLLLLEGCGDVISSCEKMATYSRCRNGLFLRNVYSLCNGERTGVSHLNRVAFNRCRPFVTEAKRKASTWAPKAATGLVIVVGGVYMLYTPPPKIYVQEESVVIDEPIIVHNVPNFELSRRIVNPSDTTGLKLTLFQYPTCPFCCKVRAFLDYYGFSYDIVEVDPVLRQQIKWSDYKKVPILLVKRNDGSYLQLNDSTLIISVLKTFLKDQSQSLEDLLHFYPTIQYNDQGKIKAEVPNRYFLMYQESNYGDKSKQEVMHELKWRKWADDTLVHVLSPNVYRTREEALQSFEWFSEVGEWDRLFPSWERYLIVYAGAYAMWMIGKRLKKRHHLKEDVRESLYDECRTWMKTLRESNSKFCGGREPNMADLAVYGVLNSIEGCEAFKDALENTSIGTWYINMRDAVGNHRGSEVMLSAK